MSNATKSILAQFVARYGPEAGEDGPVLFVREVFGQQPDPWQEEVLREYGRGGRKIAVKSCHGSGKTHLAGWLVWHMLLTKYPQQTVATAPTSGQLDGALLPRIKSLGRQLPPILQQLFEVKARGIYLKAAPEDSFFEARTARAEAPEALQGVHSDNVLLIGDEASGIPEGIYKASAGSMSGGDKGIATTLLIGNPTRTSGFFFECFHSMQHSWFTRTVSHKDSVRVTDEFVRDIAERYGEDSSEFRIRCLGEFPLVDDSTVIPWELINAARERDVHELPNARRAWGVDVARYGMDRTALAERTGRSGRILEVWQGLDLMQTTGRIKARYDALPPDYRPEVILVDDIGLGSGVLDRLRELGLPARGVNVAESSSMSDKFIRARSELWWKCREWLQTKAVRLDTPDQDNKEDVQNLLMRELTMPTYSYTSTGKIQVESKADTKKNSQDGRSPDIADAFVLTFAEDLTAATYGSTGSTRWNEPLSRGIPVV